MLHPQLHERLKDVAAHLGVAPATVATMAIGEYVARQTAALGAVGNAIDKMIDQVSPQLQEQLRLLEAPPARKTTLAVTTSRKGKK
jgi:RecA-family ATPase